MLDFTLLRSVAACCEKIRDPFGENKTCSDVIVYYCINPMQLISTAENERIFCLQTSYQRIQLLNDLCTLLLQLQTNKSTALWHLHSCLLYVIGRSSEIRCYSHRRQLPLPTSTNFVNIQQLQTYLEKTAKIQRRTYLHTYYQRAGLCKLLRGRPVVHLNVLDYLTDSNIMEHKANDSLHWELTNSAENHDRRQEFQSSSVIHVVTTVCSKPFSYESTKNTEIRAQLYLNVVHINTNSYRFCTVNDL